MPKRSKPYRSKVKIGVDSAGKPIVKYIQGYTRAELEAARKTVIARFITGAALCDDRLFGDYAAEWYRVRKAPFISESSKQSYRTALNKDLFPLLGDRNLRAITAMELQEIVNGFEGKNGTKITVIIATLRGVFASALADRMISVNPADHLVKPNAAAVAQKHSLTPEQRGRLEAVCASHPRGHYLALMYYLGCRPGEARGLQWGDIDWQAGRVHIQRDIDYKDGGRAGALKTRTSDRVVPLSAPLRAILASRRGLPETYIVHGGNAGQPLAKTSAERLWLELMREAGMIVDAKPNKYRDGDPRARYAAVITPHALRHNFITMCWEYGLDPYETMKLVGHTSITTTMNIYTHLSEAQMQKTALKLDDMFGKTKGVPTVAEKLH